MQACTVSSPSLCTFHSTSKGFPWAAQINWAVSSLNFLISISSSGCVNHGATEKKRCNWNYKNHHLFTSPKVTYLRAKKRSNLRNLTWKILTALELNIGKTNKCSNFSPTRASFYRKKYNFCVISTWNQTKNVDFWEEGRLPKHTFARRVVDEVRI